MLHQRPQFGVGWLADSAGFDDGPETAPNSAPGLGGQDIMTSWTNSGSGGPIEQLHTNTDKDNIGLHGGFTTNSKFGSHGMRKGWMDYITAKTSAKLIDAFDFGSGDFTIDFWLMPTPFNSQHPFGVKEYQPQGFLDTERWWIRTYGHSSGSPNGLGGTVVFYFQDLPGKTFCFNFPPGTNSAGPTNVWNHWAFVRHGNTFKLYINGLEAIASIDTSVEGLTITPISENSAGLAFGYNGSGQLMNCIFDEFRVSKGIARWTVPFSTKLPTTPYDP